jgi:hypothetical protein
VRALCERGWHRPKLRWTQGGGQRRAARRHHCWRGNSTSSAMRLPGRPGRPAPSATRRFRPPAWDDALSITTRRVARPPTVNEQSGTDGATGEWTPPPRGGEALGGTSDSATPGAAVTGQRDRQGGPPVPICYPFKHRKHPSWRDGDGAVTSSWLLSYWGRARQALPGGAHGPPRPLFQFGVSPGCSPRPGSQEVTRRQGCNEQQG